MTHAGDCFVTWTTSISLFRFLSPVTPPSLTRGAAGKALCSPLRKGGGGGGVNASEVSRSKEGATSAAGSGQSFLRGVTFKGPCDQRRQLSGDLKDGPRKWESRYIGPLVEQGCHA